MSPLLTRSPLITTSCVTCSGVLSSMISSATSVPVLLEQCERVGNVRRQWPLVARCACRDHNPGQRRVRASHRVFPERLIARGVGIDRPEAVLLALAVRACRALRVEVVADGA